MIDTERKEDLFLDTKLIKSENRLGKLRIIDELHPVLGGQPTHEKDQPNDNNPFLDLACTMQFTIDKVNAVDKKADTKLAKAQNLKDVANVAIARDNLGLGTSATMNATSTLSDRTDQTATIKAVNDVNRAASTAQKTANNAHALAQTKQDKLTFVGDGPEVMKTGAFGFGDVGTEDKIIGIRDFFQLPLSNAIYTIAGEWNNGPRGKVGYTGIAQTIVRKYRAGREFVIIYWENGRVWWTSRNSGEWENWEQYITTENTTTDKSGFLRASGSANAVITTDIATKSKTGITRLDSSLSDAEDRAATPKAVNDVNRAASTAQKTANNAHALAQTKQDKLTFVGDGPEVMKTGAFGLGARSPALNIKDFNDVPLVNATYTIAGEAINGPRGSGTYTGTLDVIVRLYNAGPVIATVFREADKVWERVMFGGDWRDWKEYLTTSNTTPDKSGFLRASGSANALVESDVTNSLGNSKTLVASQALVNSLAQKIDDVPVDKIFAFDSAIPPKGYIARNGQAIDKNTMPKLYARYGAKMPDDRDRVHRMAGSLAGTAGSTQEDAIRNITGSFVADNETGNNTQGVFYKIENLNWGGNPNDNQGTRVGFDASKFVPTASENRVKSRIVIFCNKIQ